LLDAVLPSYCFGCHGRLGASQAFGACQRCWLSLDPAPSNLSQRGGLSVWNAVHYSRHARETLLRAKFGRRRELFLPMGRMLAALTRQFEPPSWIVPVPSHPGHTLFRGFSPSRELARPLAHSTGVPIRRALGRKWWPWGAVKRLGRSKRRGLAEKVFYLRERMTGESVLLVDDLMTTGSTLEACAKLCALGGASEVRALVWARATQDVLFK
jgi:predicted amidophosphoribosyltransferase